MLGEKRIREEKESERGGVFCVRRVRIGVGGASLLLVMCEIC